MQGLRKAVLIVAVIAVLAVSLLYTWRMRPENAIVVGPGGEIQYDDFAFSVDAALRLPYLVTGTDRLEARGEWVIVTLGVRNHAQRVDFRFKPEVVRLMADDAPGGATEFTVNPVAASVFAAEDGCSGPIPPGGSCSTQIPFDVPAGARGLRLRLQFDGPLADALDTLVYGRMSLAVPEG